MVLALLQRELHRRQIPGSLDIRQAVKSQSRVGFPHEHLSVHLKPGRGAREEGHLLGALGVRPPRTNGDKNMGARAIAAATQPCPSRMGLRKSLSTRRSAMPLAEKRGAGTARGKPGYPRHTEMLGKTMRLDSGGHPTRHTAANRNQHAHKTPPHPRRRRCFTRVSTSVDCGINRDLRSSQPATPPPMHRGSGSCRRLVSAKEATAGPRTKPAWGLDGKNRPNPSHPSPRDADPNRIKIPS